METPDSHPKKVVLALQGGAALGAFGWGVLDRLLQDDRLEIEGVSGTSSGAVNAALLAYGLIENNRDQARDLLGTFWKRISAESEKRRWGRLRSLRLLGPQILQFRRKEIFFEVMSRILLPYHYDPVTMDPLRSVIDETIDFDRLRSSDSISLFVNATNIATNKNRVFARDEVSLDALCASCCLPFLFDAVSIEGERYWDGGYMGNPTIYPLIDGQTSKDIILVLTSNLESKINPRTSAEIINRVSQVSFASALMREMRAIKFVTELIDNGFVKPDAGLTRVNIHIISPQANDPEFDAIKNFNADWSYMSRMKDKGRETAGRWLNESFKEIGHRSTVDLETMFC